MRIALGVSYDGAGFCGWQRQPDGRSVQDALEAALARINGAPAAVTAAGRTDAGVHASRQVVHFDTEAARPESAWVRGVNTWLPPGVRVMWARPVGADFHARFSALERGYSYVLLDAPVRPALLHGRAGWFHLPLDLERMRAAAALLVGRHDFSAFRAAGCQAASPVRELRALDIVRHGPLLVFGLRADAFLYHMVRNIVGSLVYVGKKRYPPEWLGEVLRRRERARAAPTFAPDGLYLTQVGYDARWELPGGDADLTGLPWLA